MSVHSQGSCPQRSWESSSCVPRKLKNEMEAAREKKYICSLIFWVPQMLDLGLGLFPFALRGGSDRALDGDRKLAATYFENFIFCV